MGIASPAAAAKARGPRKIVAKYEPPARVVTAKKAARKQSLRGIEASQMVCIEASQMVSAAKQGVHGRLRMHGPRRIMQGEDDRRKSLAQKKQRRTVHVHSVLASGAADFEEAPGRDEFADDETGALLHEQSFHEYVDGNFDDAGAEVR